MQIIYPPSSGGYAATFPLGGGRSRADGIRPYPVLQFLLWPPAAPIQNRFFMWGATTPARHGTTSQVRHSEAERSNPRPPSPDVPHTSICSASAAFPHRHLPFWWLPLGEAVERSETDEGKGPSTSSASPHPSFAPQMPPSPRGRQYFKSYRDKPISILQTGVDFS